jgi:hypothetical protein
VLSICVSDLSCKCATPCVVRAQVLNATVDALAGASGRAELLEWMATQIEANVLSSAPHVTAPCLGALCPPAITCLLSKEHACRGAAQRIIG